MEIAFEKRSVIESKSCETVVFLVWYYSIALFPKLYKFLNRAQPQSRL